jgi:hypothetical protein
METSVNNKCRAFTSLEQSRKLAEILPIESADMYWDYDVQKHEYYPMVMDDQFDDTCIRAWSLAALLSVIPQEIFDGEYIINITEGCDNRWVLTYDHYENKNHSYYGLSTGADNLVDACVNMIERLHERKML